MNKMTTLRVISHAIAVTILLGLHTSADAHALLDNAMPKVGSVVSMPPKAIRIQFTQRIEVAFSHIHLFTAGGQEVAMGTAATDSTDQTVMLAPINGALTPGQYEVRWDVLSVDTHRTNGHFPFTYQP